MEARGSARELIATRIFDLLAVEKVLGRRYLQTALVGYGGFQPEHITDTLEVLVDSGKLERTDGAGVGCTFHMYSLPGTDRVAVKRCERDIVLGHKIQRAAKLGEVGETYVRAVMLRSESFFRIPQKKRMGKIKARDGKRIDMSARLKWAPQIRVIIEVKNEYEVFPQSDPVFWHLASTAMTEDCFPILAAVNVSDAARIMCNHLGIAVLELGR